MKPISIANTNDLSHAQWLEMRTMYLGGSDAGTVLGVNPYNSKAQLFLEKTDPDLKHNIDNEYMYWGRVMEDVVAKEFERRTGKKVRRDNRMLVHPEHDFMLANIDRVVVGEKALLECKTTSHWNKDQWEDDEIPPHYLCQIQHYLAVTGYDKAYVAVLIGGNNFIWKEIERDEELIKIIINAEKSFWEDNIQVGKLPEIDGSKGMSDFLNHMYSDIDDAEIELSEDTDRLAKAVESLKADIKEKRDLQSKYENQIKDTLGNHVKGSSSKYLVTWKPVTSKRLDKKKLIADYGKDTIDYYHNESTTRRLTIKEIKEDA